MKKILVIAAAACTVLASCQKEAPVASVQNDGQQEITFSALSKAMTKGVLQSGDSFNGGSRTIEVAGVVEASDGKWVDFLEETTFSQDGTTGIWKAGKYYPLGSAATNFLAYSETHNVTSTARWYGAKEVELQVTEETCPENDIVYAAFLGNKTTTPTPIFNHTQALVTVSIKTSAGTIKINKIGFEDVKTSGTLNIKLTPNKSSVSTTGNATATWIFNAGCTCHYAEMAARKLSEAVNPAASTPKEVEFESVSGFPGDVATTAVVLDRLFPAQKLAAKTLIVNYTLGDYTADARLEFETDKQKTWEAGKNYKYDITVTPKEIEIDPTAVDSAWTLETITEILN